MNAHWRRLPFFLGIASSALLAACSTMAPRPAAAPPPPSTANTTAAPPTVAGSTLANNVLIRAIGLVGTPYHWGGNTPTTGFDCSGLVDYVFRSETGIELPRSSREIAATEGQRVPRDQLRAGDLVFFGRRHRVNHVGIYVGNGRFVNAPSTGGTVRLDRLDGYYWRSHYLFAKRVLTPRIVSTLATD